jgi:hypothetical protein
MMGERRRGAPRVKFDPPLRAQFMAIDGTWCRKCLIRDVSESGAQLEFEGLVAGVSEFFLVLSEGARPAFRRSKVVWVNANTMGAQFDKAGVTANPGKSKPMVAAARPADAAAHA